MPPVATIGAMLERLVLQTYDPSVIAVASLARAATTATVTTEEPHGFESGDYVTIAGAIPAGYNGRVKIVVVSALVFTYTASVALATPASGTMTAVYVSDAQGGRRLGWMDLATVPAQMMAFPQRGASEPVQAQAVTATQSYRFRIRVRTDVTPKMRALWTPRWPPGAFPRTLEIHGVLPVEDGRRFQVLECGVLN